eukprot:scaffold8352_cov135-Skeletonema_dohrnii-CCMP3373.AAC.9
MTWEGGEKSKDPFALSLDGRDYDKYDGSDDVTGCILSRSHSHSNDMRAQTLAADISNFTR